MIKIVFFDVDGTLLSEKSLRIPPSAVYSLGELQKKGIKIIAATGRGPYVSHLLEKETGLIFDGYISLNGQYCFTAKEILHKEAIDKTDIFKLGEFLENNSVSCDFLGEDFILRNKESKEANLSDSHLGEMASPFIYSPLSQILDRTIYQIKAYIPQKRDRELEELLPASSLLRWKELYTAIFAKNGGKHQGVKIFLNHFGLEKNESLGFGNGSNDLLFFNEIGSSIAMADSPRLLKEKASYISSAPDEDGIYEGLLKFELIPQAELWDALYEDETPAGFYLVRNLAIAKGYYHLVVEVIISHQDGDYLLVRRSKEKNKLPGRWESSASGSALPGESSLEAAKREVKEETGIDRGDFTFLSRRVYPELGAIFHDYHCLTDFDKNALVMQKGETDQYRWLSKKDFLSFMDSDKSIPWQKDRLNPYLLKIKKE